MARLAGVLPALLVAAVAGLAAPPAYADAKMDQIRARGRLIISVKNDAQRPHRDPAHFDKRGFEVELVHALAAHILGDPSRVELRTLARPVRPPMLESGAVDLVVSMIAVTPENALHCDFSHPYFATGLSLLVPAKAPPLTLPQLAGKTVAFRKQSYNDHGAELQRVASESGIAVTIRYYPSFERAVEAVAKGEAIAMGGNFVDLEAYRKAHDGYAVNDKLLDPRDVAVAVRKGDKELLALVNATIDELRRSGALARMAQKWHLPYLLPPV